MTDGILQVAQRIQALRQIWEFTQEEMAQATDTTLEEYQKLEAGQSDFSFTFLFKCAKKLGVDLAELVTGEDPKLSFYTVVRKGKGLAIRRRAGFEYQHMAYLLKDRLAEPFIVTAPYREEDQQKEIALSTHKGQEYDLVLKGKLKVRLENHYEILEAGDSVYYNSAHGHGMIAVGGEECVFLAVVIGTEE